MAKSGSCAISISASAELNSLRLLFLFVARRGTDTIAANYSYDKIEEYRGINRDKIRLLVTCGLVLT